MNRILLTIALMAFAWNSSAQADYALVNLSVALRTGADAAVRQEIIVVDMVAPTKVRHQVKQAITVFNSRGEHKARLAIYYNKSTVIKRITGKLFNADGLQIGKFTQRDFRDESAVNNFSLYEDTRVKHFLPSMNNYPYTVEYEYELEHKQNLIIPAWRPDAYPDVSVEHSRYTFIGDAAAKVRIKTMNYADEAVVTETDGRKSTTWKVSDLPSQRYEPYSPDPETYKIWVRVAPVDFSYYKHTGSYTNWEELGKWSYEALLVDGLVLPQKTIQEVQGLVAGLSTDQEKAKVLYAYLQRKTRYVSVQVGIGGFKPIPASEVDRLGYGDCKGLVNYMQALLTAVDIPSYYCVVQAGSAKRDIQSDFAGMEQGNHIILCLPFENDTTWLECTSQRAPYGFLGTFTDDRSVLACTPEGGKLLRTPKYSMTASTQWRTARFEMAEDGTLAGSATTAFAGSQYDNHLAIAESSGSDRVKLLKAAYDIDQINFSNIGYEKSDDPVPALVESFDLTIAKYAPKNGEQLFLVPNVFSRQPSIQAVSNRKRPMYINRGFTDEDRISVTLPDGYTMAAEGWDELIDSPFGSYQTTFTQEGDQLVYLRKLILNEGSFASEQYADFHDFITRVTIMDNRKVVLTKR